MKSWRETHCFRTLISMTSQTSKANYANCIRREWCISIVRTTWAYSVGSASRTSTRKRSALWWISTKSRRWGNFNLPTLTTTSHSWRSEATCLVWSLTTSKRTGRQFRLRSLSKRWRSSCLRRMKMRRELQKTVALSRRNNICCIHTPMNKRNSSLRQLTPSCLKLTIISRPLPIWRIKSLPMGLSTITGERMNKRSRTMKTDNAIHRHMLRTRKKRRKGNMWRDTTQKRRMMMKSNNIDDKMLSISILVLIYSCSIR